MLGKNIRKRIDSTLENFSHIYGHYINPVETVSVMDLKVLDMDTEEKGMYAAAIKKSLGKDHASIKIGDDNIAENLAKMNDTSLKEGRTFIAEKIRKAVTASGKNYGILFVCDTMDVPGELESTEQVSYIVCSICQVKDPKAVLRYDSKEFRGSSTGSILSSPVAGIVYPYFDEDGSDLTRAALFSKNSEMFDSLAGILSPSDEILSPDSQLEIFNNAVSESLGDECTIENVQELLVQSEGSKDIRDIKRNMRSIGISEGCIEAFEEEASALDQISLPKKTDLTIKTSECTLKVPNEVHLQTKQIDGITYILVPAGSDVTVNGIPVVIGD